MYPAKRNTNGSVGPVRFGPPTEHNLLDSAACTKPGSTTSFNYYCVPEYFDCNILRRYSINSPVSGNNTANRLEHHVEIQ